MLEGLRAAFGDGQEIDRVLGQLRDDQDQSREQAYRHGDPVWISAIRSAPHRGGGIVEVVGGLELVVGLKVVEVLGTVTPLGPSGPLGPVAPEGSNGNRAPLPASVIEEA